MNPHGFDENLFRGIPAGSSRGPGSFFTSLIVHTALVALALLATPQLIVTNKPFHVSATLIAPPEEKPAPKRVTPPPVLQAEAPPPRALRELPRPAEPRITSPKLEEAPALPNAPRPAPVIPEQNVVIRPPVQTGLFAGNTPPPADPKLPAAPARQAGFDTAPAPAPATPPVAPAASAGFDVRALAPQPAATARAIQTGAFGETAATDPRSARTFTGKVTRAAFDMQVDSQKPAALNQTVRKTGFDEPAPAAAPAKAAASTAAAVRPIEILEKPKPAYTPEARAQKIEGTVLLDVVFAATGEVRVLGVVRGLGHGLDESAVDAARRIRFTPAKQAGTPVDQRVLLHVVFQITG